MQRDGSLCNAPVAPSSINAQLQSELSPSLDEGRVPRQLNINSTRRIKRPITKENKNGGWWRKTLTHVA
jgi:hypothetical protein